MYYNDFKELKLSALGFGAMRMPVIEGGTAANVDEEKVAEMIDYAIKNGVNYFDTAYPYHDGRSEIVIGKILSKYPRESYYLADKFPGHEVLDSYDPEAIFEEQLKKCGVDYFDFYLLHNVNNSSIKRYFDENLGIPEYFIEQKKLGRIKHLGISCHGDLDCINSFFDRYPDDFEFCQIQLNYLDWTLQDAEAKYELFEKRGIPVWVMEPCRGGKLANLPENIGEKLKQMNPDASFASWAFRFLQGKDNVKMILSGMGDLDQMKDNCATFEKRDPLTEQEESAVFEVASKLLDSVPCTGCRYCCKGCPMEINIPWLIALYNDTRFSQSINVSMNLKGIDEDKMPSACIGCGQCAAICPQGIDVPSLMIEMDKVFAQVPSWEEISRARTEARKKAFNVN